MSILSSSSGSTFPRSWSRTRTSISSSVESRLTVLLLGWATIDSSSVLTHGLTSPELVLLAPPECTQAVVELLYGVFHHCLVAFLSFSFLMRFSFLACSFSISLWVALILSCCSLSCSCTLIWYSSLALLACSVVEMPGAWEAAVAEAVVSLLFPVLEPVLREGRATAAGLEEAAVAEGFSLVALVEEEAWEEEVVLVTVLEEEEGWEEDRLGAGFNVGGAMHGVVGRDAGFISHLDLLPAGLFWSVFSLFLLSPVAMAPSSLLPSPSSSPASPSQGAGTTGGAPHCLPWVVAPGTVAA